MRQFILGKQKIKNGLVQIDQKDFKYLRQVLRVKVGDMVSLRLNDGTLQNSTVVIVDDKMKVITLQLCASTDKVSSSITRGVQASEFDSNIKEMGIEYYLFQILPKPQKFELIVRQATECGISKIIPIIGEYTEKSSVMALNGGKKERIERIIREARQQSGSPVATEVLSPVNIDEALALFEKCEQNIGFVLSERDDCSKNLKNSIEEKKNKNIQIKKVGIVVGSEGGISPEEVKKFEEQLNFIPIHFAVNILRCETAALYGIAAVQSAVN